MVMLVWYWKMLWRIAALTSLCKAYGIVLNEKKADHAAWIKEEEICVLSKRIYSLLKEKWGMKHRLRRNIKILVVG